MNKSSSSKAELQEAVRKLEEFTHQTAELQTASPITKTIALMRDFLRNEEHDPQEIQKAIDIIQRQRLFIQQLQHGTAAEKKLAESVNQAVKNYNIRCYELKNSSCKGIRKLFSKRKIAAHKSLPSIDLPQPATFKLDYPAKQSGLSSTHCLSTSAPLTKQSKELFQMKVLALLERYGIASNPEARAIVKQAPILTAKEDGKSTYTLSQTLSLFPGQTIVVMGSSALDTKTQTISNLFPESFSITLESTQTGFPHPSQRAGWTLVNQLLPELPQRLDLLDETKKVFNCKKQLIEGLLPGGALVEVTKKLLKIKKQLFILHRENLLKVHRQLALTIVQAGQCKPEDLSIVNHFHDLIHAHLNPFDYMSEICQCLHEYFIIKPHGILLDSILKDKNINFTSLDHTKRYSTSLAIMDHALKSSKLEIQNKRKSAISPNEVLKWDYINVFGSLIGPAAQSIILQYFSEDLRFTPPVLTLFERMLQDTAYAHVLEFYEELTNDKIDSENVYAFMESQLQSDIARFKQNHFIIPDELANYYHQRAACI